MAPASSSRESFAPLALASLALVGGGCGWTTGLREEPAELDAGPPSDAGSTDLTVDCGRRTRYSSPRRPIALVAEVHGAAEVIEDGWTLTARPAGSTSTNAPVSGAATTLEPDVTGSYLLRYDVIDDGGRSASCQVTVESIVGPPVALCPEAPVLRVPTGESTLVEGGGYDDQGVVAYQWAVRSAPAGATYRLAPTDGPATRFLGSLPGDYTLELTVYDADGASGSCAVDVRVTAPPVVRCPSGVVSAPTRRPTPIAATATDDRAVVQTLWALVVAPAGSAPTLVPDDTPSTRFTPDRQGSYVLRFTAVDDDGLEASCTVDVVGTPTPPTATCPDRVTTRPLVPTSLVGGGVDDGTIVSYQWSVTSAPAGSMAAPPVPTHDSSTTFVPDIVGEYTLRLTVTDDDGSSGACTATVAALATEGLRIELFWDAAPDMDLHLLHPAALFWDGPLDCFYADCNAAEGLTLDWFAPGPADDPHLDIDDTDGFGPENTNIDVPAPGTYRVGVHAYFGTSSAVTVRVYCGGGTTTPVATYGPIALPDDHLWRVVDVTIGPSGCVLADLRLASGAPNVTPFSGPAEPR